MQLDLDLAPMQRHHCGLRHSHHKLAERPAATVIVASYRRARSVRLVLRENVGRGDGRGREILGFAFWEMCGHAEPSIHVAPQVLPDVEPGVESGVGPISELGCRAPHSGQSPMLAPPSHARVKARLPRPECSGSCVSGQLGVQMKQTRMRAAVKIRRKCESLAMHKN